MTKVIVLGAEREIALKITKLLLETGIKEVENVSTREEITFTMSEPSQSTLDNSEYRSEKVQWKREKNGHRKYWR